MGFGMENKHKKTILRLIVLSAIVLSITAMFTPIACYDGSDVLKELYGIENPEKYIKIELSPLLHHGAGYNFSDPDSPSEHHQYRFFNLLKFETGKPVTIDSSLYLSTLFDEPYPIEDDLFFSGNIAGLIYALLSPIFLFFYAYICYKGIENIGIKKTRYFLHIGILSSIVGIIFIATFYYLINIIDFGNWGLTNFITLGYGFYIGITATVLFFLAYIMQNYYVKYPKEKPTMDDNLVKNK